MLTPFEGFVVNVSDLSGDFLVCATAGHRERRSQNLEELVSQLQKTFGGALQLSNSKAEIFHIGF